MGEMGFGKLSRRGIGRIEILSHVTKKRDRESFLNSSSSRWQTGGMPRRPRLAGGDLAYAGTGPVYQGRFTSFPVQTDEHILTVARYVERNARRATLVSRAKDWRWGSGWRRTQGDPESSAWLSDWPIERP